MDFIDLTSLHSYSYLLVLAAILLTTKLLGLFSRWVRLPQVLGALVAGAMMAGLLVNAGVGLLILFRLNRDRVQNLKIVGVLYGLGVFWGIIIEFAGIVF